MNVDNKHEMIVLLKIIKLLYYVIDVIDWKFADPTFIFYENPSKYDVGVHI